jgi:5-formyltetrahydrofolate cyclo-ligase
LRSEPEWGFLRREVRILFDNPFEPWRFVARNMSPHQAIKQQARTSVQDRVRAIATREWLEHDRSICAQLAELSRTMLELIPAGQGAVLNWMMFLPIARAPRDEVDLSEFVTQCLNDPHHRVCLPRTDWANKSLTPVPVQNLSTDIVLGRYSLREPRADLPELALDELDVVIVPGLAFDATGARLGRGGGFYDRLLERIATLPAGKRPTCVGVCLDEQMVEKVPVEAHDLRVDMMVTPSRNVPRRATGSHAGRLGE